MKNYPLYEVRQIASIRDMQKQSVQEFGDKPAFLVKKERGGPYTPISYVENDKDITSLGTAFLTMGLSGKRIAVISENRYEWAVTYFAAVNGESVIVPIDKELPFDDWSHLLSVAEVSAVVYSQKFSADMVKVKASIPSLEILVNMDLLEDTEHEKSFAALLREGRRLVTAGNHLFDEVEIDVEAPRILLFTSGTTALSKGVWLSHKNITVSLMSMSSMLYVGCPDVFLSVLPLHHTYECTCGFLCAYYRGCTIAYCEGLRYILANLKEAKATVMLGVPAIFETMYKRIWATAKKSGIENKLKLGLKIANTLGKVHIDVRKKLFKQIHDTLGGHVRLFISGAAGINPEIAKGFRNMGILFVQGYGITECSPIVCLNRDHFFKDDAAGYPMPCMDVKLIDVGSDGIGEIVCRGENVMLGYYKDDAATKEVMEGGWFHTGDLAYQDKDGFFHITGRKKNVIVTQNGKNIFPEELETYLNENANVLESMVYGEEDETGETVLCALLVPNFEHIGKDASDEQIRSLMEAAIKEVNQRNPLYKYIRKFEIRKEELQKTTTKKVKRYLEKPAK